MAVDRHVMAGSINDRLRAADIVKVGVEHGNDRPVGDGSQFVERCAHLLHALPGVDRDDAVGSFDEGLVRQPVPDEAPHAGAHLVEPSGQHLVVGGVGRMSDLTAGQSNGVRALVFERTTGTGLSWRHGQNLVVRHLTLASRPPNTTIGDDR